MKFFIKLQKPKTTEVFKTYWEFAYKRQNIFFSRIKGENNSIEDSILQKHKFTNVYRASDRVSQYLIKEVIYNKVAYSDKDMLLRILLFKIFNKISTWEFLESQIGDICCQNFDINTIDNLLSEIKNIGEPIYSGAYIMTSGKSSFGYDYKHQNHLALLDKYIIKGNVLEKIQMVNSLEEVYNILLDLPTIGEFLAFQYAIDINYSNIINYSEMDFVQAGPGAKDGIAKCFSSLGEYTFSDIIKYMADNQEVFFEKYELNFQNLYGRRLQLIDCQNLFCEVDKYARVAHPNIEGKSNRKKIKQLYKPNTNNIEYFYPPKWNLEY